MNKNYITPVVIFSTLLLLEIIFTGVYLPMLLSGDTLAVVARIVILILTIVITMLSVIESIKNLLK